MQNIGEISLVITISPIVIAGVKKDGWIWIYQMQFWKEVVSHDDVKNTVSKFQFIEKIFTSLWYNLKVEENLMLPWCLKQCKGWSGYLTYSLCNY